MDKMNDVKEIGSSKSQW